MVSIRLMPAFSCLGVGVRRRCVARKPASARAETTRSLGDCREDRVSTNASGQPLWLPWAATRPAPTIAHIYEGRPQGAPYDEERRSGLGDQARYCWMRVVRRPARPCRSIEYCQERNSSTVSV